MNVTSLKIRIFGEPVLRKKARPVKQVNDEMRNILNQMSRIMYESSGIGLAAPQVGINASMVVVDAGSGLYKLINPKILKKQGSGVMEEGCLSVPGVCIKIKRAKKVLIKALDDTGRPVTIEAEDLLARVFQHEIDHLRGKLIVDYASVFTKLRISGALKELREKAENEGLSESETKSCKLQL
ncbi:MAG: peptide deformylase [Omnitrophica WOR_2 bacterium RBG_13_44_8b]|nr:MAG: peptide deformylase [Omnitrophica WOR_2 bacterium RBG_13_44_8b]